LFVRWIFNRPAVTEDTNREGDDKEESKSEAASSGSEDEHPDAREGAAGYNIKRLSAKMNGRQIEELALKELGIKEDQARACNRLVQRFNDLRVDDKGLSSAESQLSWENDEGETNQEAAPTPAELLASREKGQKLTHNQRVLLYKLIKIEKVAMSVLASKYSLSTSTIKRVISYYGAHSDELATVDEDLGSKIFTFKNVNEAIKDFIETQETPTHAKDV